MAEILTGTILNVGPDGVTVRVPYGDWERLTDRHYNTVRVEFPDARQRTADQLKKAWAIMADMAVYTGGDKETDVYRPLAADFANRVQKTLQKELFHLSTASVTEARDFISFLLDTCLEMEIPLSQPAADLTDDIQHYVYSCTVNRKCAVCGKRADLHHVDAVGMGRNRQEITHTGMRALPLCREHHQEAHTIGNAPFMARYHLEPITIDEKIAEKLKLGRRNA